MNRLTHEGRAYWRSPGDVLASVIVALSMLARFATPASAATNLTMACASPVAPGTRLSPSVCPELIWTRPNAATLVASSTAQSPTWGASESQWRLFGSLPTNASTIRCTRDIPLDSRWAAGVAGADPCPSEAKPWLAICSCPGIEPPPPTRTGFKWHPGHYMTLDNILQTPEIRARNFREIDAIANEPAIKGVKLFIYWGAIEKAKGDYSAGFAIIDEYLAHLKAAGNKRLILSIQDRIFGGYEPAREGEYLPAWLVKEQGKTASSVHGRLTMARVWQKPTMDHYIAMLKAFGARYDAHPNFEMMQAEETSVSLPRGLDGYSLLAYGAQVQRMLSAVRPAWPNTILRLSTNFYGSDAQMQELIEFCDLLDVAVGGPDIIPDQMIQANRIYDAKFRGKMIWVSEVQSPSLGGKEGTFTAKEIYESGMQQQPSHFLWIRNTWQAGSAQKWDTGLLPFIRSINGAVKAACPANVEGCKGL